MSGENQIFCICRKPEDGLPMIQCSSCSEKFHSKCVNLRSVVIHRLIRERIQWRCSDCISRSDSQNSCFPVSQANSESQNSTRVKCPFCPEDDLRTFQFPGGLRKHNTHAHKEDDIESFICQHLSQESDFDLGTEMSSMKSNVRVLSRIPKSARHLIASHLTSIIDNCILENSFDAWSNLLLFAYTALRVPDKQKGKSLSQLVKDNVCTRVKPSIRYTKRNQSSFSKRIEAKVANFDIRGAVRLLTSTDSFALNCEETFNELLKKHPIPSREQIWPQPPHAQTVSLIVDVFEVKKAILSFPSGSGSGIDGLLPQHLKDLISHSAGDSGVKFLSCLTKLCNFLLSGNLNPEVCPFLYGASLCALQKKRRRYQANCSWLSS